MWSRCLQGCKLSFTAKNFGLAYGLVLLVFFFTNRNFFAIVMVRS